MTAYEANRQRRLEYAKRIARRIYKGENIPSTWVKYFDSQNDEKITYRFHNGEYGYYATFDKATGKLTSISDNYHNWKGWNFSDSIYYWL